MNKLNTTKIQKKKNICKTKKKMLKLSTQSAKQMLS